MNYISMVENTHDRHRSHIILHRSMWYIAEFEYDLPAELFDIFREEAAKRAAGR